MAQTQSIYNNPLSGNLGNQTYKNYGGKQVVTTRFRTTSAKGDGASRAQRDTRMLMPNLTLIGSQLKDWLPVLWENNKFFGRPYTHFISHNMQRDLLVQPKELIDDKRCIWGKLQISCGSLPVVTCTQQLDVGFWTNIVCPNNTNLGSMNLSDFSAAILGANPNYKEGDFIVFVRAFYEEINSEAPQVTYYCIPSISAITLDTYATGSVSANIKGDSITLKAFSPSSGQYRLGVNRSDDASWACVHVRKERGKYLASNQVMSWVFYGADDIDYLERQDYLDYCAASWGYKDKIL